MAAVWEGAKSSALDQVWVCLAMLGVQERVWGVWEEAGERGRSLRCPRWEGLRRTVSSPGRETGWNGRRSEVAASGTGWCFGVNGRRLPDPFAFKSLGWAEQKTCVPRALC